MRVLLDEWLPHELALLLSGHEVATVQGKGWAGTKNGILLALASEEFDVLVSADQNIPYQQNLRTFDIRIVIVVATRNRIDDIRPLLARLLESIDSSIPGYVSWVRA